ncbi:UV excision repair protein RAD23 like [Schistosoma japonicum]|nr:UV excision repair protein RAD23 like [Schistosoma japonicum]
MARHSKSCARNKVQFILVENLSTDVDNEKLKSIIPSARRIILRNRSAFLTFSTNEGHANALCRLKKVKFDRVKSPSSKPDANSQPSLPTVTTTQSTTTNTLGFGESSLATGENFERVVQELVSMGFEKPLVIRAMRAGFNNPDRAFEYLSSGNIPNIDIVDQPSQREGSESVSPEAPGDADTPGSESAGSEDPIAALASLPQFQQMRALVQANPELLPQLIQQIGNDNADLFRVRIILLYLILCLWFICEV